MTKKREYWDVSPNREQEKDLSPELFEELNRLPEECQNVKSGSTGRKPTVVKFIGLILALVFVVMVLAPSMRVFNLPIFNFLTESMDLTKDPEIRELQRAVVLITAKEKRGSGFNIAPGGIIITNHHVVSKARSVTVAFSSDRIFVEKKRYSFPEIDLAVVEITGKNLPSVELSDRPLKKGEEVFMIGNPLGFSKIVTRGQVIDRHWDQDRDKPVIMIKGKVYQGSSGSPVFNHKGQVVAIIYATVNFGEKNANKDIIGLAVPVSWLQERLHDLIDLKPRGISCELDEF